MILLDTRLDDIKAAALITCGQNGWIRFWNIHTAHCEGEFIAHCNVDSITMAVDKDNKLLVTADTSGEMKSWLLEGYFDGRTKQPSGDNSQPSLVDNLTAWTSNVKPVLYRTWNAHAECITDIEVCVRGQHVVIVSASSDCSLKLWTVSGMCIGTFGQEEHWKLDSIEVKPIPSVADVLAEIAVNSFTSEESEEELEDEVVIENMDLDNDVEFDPDYSYETWAATILGKSYASQRSQKRPRKQPHNYATLPQVGADQRPISGAALGGPSQVTSQVLKVSDLDTIGMPERPDFMTNPHKYFTDGFSDVSKKTPKLPALVEGKGQSLKFDEKTLFPKHVLEGGKESRTRKGTQGPKGGKGSSTRASSSSNKTPTILPRLRATAF